MLVSSEKAIVFLGFIAVALTMPLENGKDEVQLLKYHDDRSADGSYDFKWDKNFFLIDIRHPKKIA